MWRVIEKLRELGLEKDTLVVITSDNGPMVNDGYKDRAVELLGKHKPAGDWRGHKYTPYEGGHRLPFIVRWDGAIAAGTNDALVSLVDLGATFAALRGVTMPQEALPDSFDQSATFLDSAKPSARGNLICQDYRLNLREGNWKYIVPGPAGNTPGPKNNPLNGELYDLTTDPAEKTNLVKRQPERAKAMYATYASLTHERGKEKTALGETRGRLYVLRQLRQARGAVPCGISRPQRRKRAIKARIKVIHSVAVRVSQSPSRPKKGGRQS